MPAGGIVVGIDGSPSALAAVDEAARLASARGEPVHLVSAYGNSSALALAPEARAYVDVQAIAEQALAEGRARLQAQGVPCESHAVPGTAADALVDVAQTQGASVIVVGSRGMRRPGHLLGSVPHAVTHQAPCSVYVVRTD